jgi:hypothetical protein
MLGQAMLRLLAVLVVAWAGAAGLEQADTDPPVISLDLPSGYPVHAVLANKETGAVCHTKAELVQMGHDPGNAPDTCDPTSATQTIQSSYAKRCHVLTDTKLTCAEPSATAFDHHDGKLDVTKAITLLLRSLPRENPKAVGESVPDVNYNMRGEYVLRYDAEDSSGNKAENLVFAMVLIGKFFVG